MRLGQIRDRSGDTERSVHRANGQAEARDRFFEKEQALVIENTILPKFLCREVRVAKAGDCRPPLRRAKPCRFDPRTHGSGILAVVRGRQLFPGDGSHRHVKIDAIEQRARELARVSDAVAGVAGARVPRIAEESAGTRIHRRDEQHVAREHGGALGADDREAALLERLADGFEHVTPKHRQLVEEKDPAMGE